MLLELKTTRQKKHTKKTKTKNAPVERPAASICPALEREATLPEIEPVEAKRAEENRQRERSVKVVLVVRVDEVAPLGQVEDGVRAIVHPAVAARRACRDVGTRSVRVLGVQLPMPQGATGVAP